jgi:serine/threonine protein kinase
VLRGEKELSVRNRIARIVNKLGLRRILTEDPAAYYDPKLSLEEELRLQEEIERLKTVYDRSRKSPGAFDEKYEVLNVEIGKGGMARIVTGIRRSDMRPVAFKHLMLEALSQYASVKTLTALFMNEGRLLTERLNHPNVVKGFEYGVADGDYFIIMEYVEGIPLNELIGRGPMDLSQFRETALGICDAVEYVHGEGVIHRDINPKNVLVDAAGKPAAVRLIDFGLALDRKGGFMAPPGFRGYNDPYTSPQQKANFNDTDERDDIYSLGVLFYEMLTGREVARGTDPRTFQALPEAIGRGIAGCVDEDRDKRWKDINELKRGLFGAL